MPRHSQTDNQLERNLQIGVIEQPASLLIFVMQAVTTNDAPPSAAQIDAARSAAKSVIELCGATVYAVSDALTVTEAGGVAEVVLKYQEATPEESEETAGENTPANNDGDNDNGNDGGEV